MLKFRAGTNRERVLNQIAYSGANKAANIARSFDTEQVICPVSTLMAEINRSISHRRFHCSTSDLVMPDDATNCLHTALTLMGSLGTGAPAFEDYVGRPPNPRYFLQDLMRAWVLSHPTLAATIGLPLPE
jgi:hypothetical protein